MTTRNFFYALLVAKHEQNLDADRRIVLFPCLFLSTACRVDVKKPMSESSSTSETILPIMSIKDRRVNIQPVLESRRSYPFPLIELVLQYLVSLETLNLFATIRPVG